MLRLPLPIKPVLICGILSLVTLSGCATTTATVAPTDKVSCTVFGPRYWSVKDTDETIRDAKEYNAAWKALCGSYTKPAKAVQPKSSGITFKDRWFEGVKTYATVFR